MDNKHIQGQRESQDLPVGERQELKPGGNLSTEGFACLAAKRLESFALSPAVVQSASTLQLKPFLQPFLSNSSGVWWGEVHAPSVISSLCQPNLRPYICTHRLSGQTEDRRPRSDESWPLEAGLQLSQISITKSRNWVILLTIQNPTSGGSPIDHILKEKSKAESVTDVKSLQTVADCIPQPSPRPPGQTNASRSKHKNRK